MDRDVYAHWPKVNADTLQAIGRFVVAWGVLETQISEAIADVYDFNDATGLAVTANLGTKAKLELFMSGVASYKDWLPPGVDIRDVNKLAADTADVASKYRNMVAHGQPFPIHTRDDKDEEKMFPERDWVWARISARKGGVRMWVNHLNQHPFELATSETIKLIDRWTQFRSDAHQMLRFGQQFLREESDE